MRRLGHNKPASQVERFLTAFFAVFVVLLMVVSGGSSRASPGASLRVIRTTTNLSNPGFSLGNLTTIVSGVYNQFSQNLTGISGWPNKSSTISSAWSLYSIVQNISTFGTLVSTYGPVNFTIGLSALKAQGITNFYFGVHWQQPHTGNGGTPQSHGNVLQSPTNNSTTMDQYTEYWNANLTSQTVSGPTILANTNGTGGPTSSNWSGFEFYNPSGTVSQAYVNTNVQKTKPPNMGPCCVPYWATVNPEASSWLGISPFPGGRGGLWQTGWDGTPSTPTYCYPIWYEFYPQMPTWQSYPNHPCVRTGDEVQLDLFEYNSMVWGASYYDFQLGTFDQVVMNLGWQRCIQIFWDDICYTNPYVPAFIQDIVEAPTASVNGVATVQQIPSYEPILFSDEIFDFHGTVHDANWAYTNGYFTIYTLDQNCGISNTAQNWINGYGYGANGAVALFGYWQDTWITSAYNYWCT